MSFPTAPEDLLTESESLRVLGWAPSRRHEFRGVLAPVLPTRIAIYYDRRAVEALRDRLALEAAAGAAHAVPASVPPASSGERAAPASGAEFTREFELDRAAVNEQARTVELSFSSEAEVERWFGREILDHGASSVRLERMRNGGALLVNHDRDDQVGVVESVNIGADRRGRATVRFGRSARAQEIFQDVVDGIRRLVSVGYRVHRTETENQPGGVVVVRAVDWEPHEISLVSIPADDSVGVGRSEPSPTAPNIQTFEIVNRQQLIAALNERGITFDPNASDDQLRALVGAPGHSNGGASGSAEQRRAAGISAVAASLRQNGVEMDVARAIAEGTSVDDFTQRGFHAMIARQTNYQAPPHPGPQLSRGDLRDLSSFSITRGLAAVLQGRALTGIEMEMQVEAQREARESGFNLEGNFHIPGLVLGHGRRDMTATGGTNGDQGGTMIATNLGSFIDLLYARMVLRGLGAQILTGLVGNVDLPRLTSGTAPGNLAETAAATESNPTTDKVSLRPHRASTFVEVSLQLMLQSAPSVEALIRNDLLTQVALLMEARAINGSGASNQPTGILGTSGIGAVVGGTNGASPTWDHLVDLETAIATVNADAGTLGYLTNPKVRGKFKKTSIESATNAEKIWQPGDTPLNGYRTGITTQVPSNLTKGTSNGVCSALIFGNWADLILAQWGGISIMANPYIKDIEGLVRLTVNAYHDNAVRRPASFAAMQDALTS